jgi:hypothetical protein
MARPETIIDNGIQRFLAARMFIEAIGNQNIRYRINMPMAVAFFIVTDSRKEEATKAKK